MTARRCSRHAPLRAVTGGASFARTNLTGSEPLSQIASASAGLGELSVALPLPALPQLDLSALPGGGVLAVPGNVDVRPALAALSDALPDVHTPAIHGRDGVLYIVRR